MMQTMSEEREAFANAYARLLGLGVDLTNVCDKRIVEIDSISRSGVYPATFLDALARIDENAHKELGPESYRNTWI